MLLQIIKCVAYGMSVGCVLFAKIFPIYDQLNSIKEQLIASALGVPTIVISAAGFLFTAMRYIFRRHIR